MEAILCFIQMVQLQLMMVDGITHIIYLNDVWINFMLYINAIDWTKGHMIPNI